MSWITPKTDWKILYDADGKYAGDYFNDSDYNRIKNNIAFLRELAVTVYQSFNIEDMGTDKNKDDWYYSDEFNTLEDNLELINAKTYERDIGEKEVFTDNGTFIDYVELNRIEEATLLIHDLLVGEARAIPRLLFKLGTKGGIKV